MTEGRSKIGFLGVPTSAGSHNAGQDKAPDALRAAGIIERLETGGIEVRDFGNLPAQRHRPSPVREGVRDLERVATVVHKTAAAVTEIVDAGYRPLVIGGDCTITLGVVAGLARHTDIGLVYLDGDADLNTPAISGTGVLDSMGVTHLLGGGMDELSKIGPRYPLLQPGQIALLGFDPGELDQDQWIRVTTGQLNVTPAPLVRTDPVAASELALAHVRASAEMVLVHFDVDVIDTGQFPLANYPHFDGLSLDQAMQALATLCDSSAFAGLVVTEINPDHDPDGTLIDRLVDGITTCLRPRGGGSSMKT